MNYGWSHRDSQLVGEWKLKLKPSSPDPHVGLNLLGGLLQETVKSVVELVSQVHHVVESTIDQIHVVSKHIQINIVDNILYNCDNVAVDSVVGHKHRVQVIGLDGVDKLLSFVHNSLEGLADLHEHGIQTLHFLHKVHHFIKQAPDGHLNLFKHLTNSDGIANGHLKLHTAELLNKGVVVKLHVLIGEVDNCLKCDCNALGHLPQHLWESGHLLRSWHSESGLPQNFDHSIQEDLDCFLVLNDGGPEEDGQLAHSVVVVADSSVDLRHTVVDGVLQLLQGGGHLVLVSEGSECGHDDREPCLQLRQHQFWCFHVVGDLQSHFISILGGGPDDQDININLWGRL